MSSLKLNDVHTQILSLLGKQHCCPVTRAPACLAHIRKLYEAM
jgi:hypothetical protein